MNSLPSRFLSIPARAQQTTAAGFSPCSAAVPFSANGARTDLEPGTGAPAKSNSASRAFPARVLQTVRPVAQPTPDFRCGGQSAAPRARSAGDKRCEKTTVRYAPSLGREPRLFEPLPLRFAGAGLNTPNCAECWPAVARSMPSTASPRLRSSRIAAARLGIRRTNRQSSNALISSGLNMICSRSGLLSSDMAPTPYPHWRYIPPRQRASQLLI